MQVQDTSHREVGQGYGPPLPIFSDAEVFDLPEPSWLIDGLCPSQSLIVLVGDAGAGKTFTALHMAFAIATGRRFMELEVKQGNVVYLYTEGRHGLPERVEAWKKIQGVGKAEEVGVFFVPEAVDLAGIEEGEFDDLRETIEAKVPGSINLVVVDTLARCFGTGDENATQDMNRFTNRCARIRDEFGCSVMVSHHTPRSRNRERGSNALRGNVDTVIRCSESASNRISLECVKQRDGQPFEPLKLRRKTINLPGDRTSCVLHSVDSDAEDAGALDEKAIELLTALASFDSDGAEFTAWLDAVDSISPSTFKRRREKLTAEGFVTEPPNGDSKGFKYTLTASGRSVLQAERVQEPLNPSSSSDQQLSVKDSDDTISQHVDQQGLNSDSGPQSNGSSEPSALSGSGVGAFRAPPEPERTVLNPEEESSTARAQPQTARSPNSETIATRGRLQ